MNLQFFRYFVTLAEMENFTKSAERVNVVQSTFSGGIRKLEESLDTKLFERDKRNVQLTNKGKALYPKAKKLLELYMEIEQDFKYDDLKRIHLGFVQNLALDTIIAYINDYKISFPLSEVTITEDKHEQLTKLLSERKIDAFFTENQIIDTFKFNSKVVASEKLFIAVYKNHRFSKKEVLSLNDLHRERFVERSHCALYKDVYKEFEEREIKPKKVFVAHNNETVAALISSGMGITLMPKPMFDLPDVKFIELNDAEFIRDIILVWNKTGGSKSLDEFLNNVRTL